MFWAGVEDAVAVLSEKVPSDWILSCLEYDHFSNRWRAELSDVPVKHPDGGYIYHTFEGYGLTPVGAIRNIKLRY